MVVLEALVKLAQRRRVLWLHSIFHGDFTPPFANRLNNTYTNYKYT